LLPTINSLIGGEGDDTLLGSSGVLGPDRLDERRRAMTGSISAALMTSTAMCSAPAMTRWMAVIGPIRSIWVSEGWVQGTGR
jgi:hypothetical protein